MAINNLIMKQLLIENKIAPHINVLEELLSKVEERDFKQIVFAPYKIRIHDLDQRITNDMLTSDERDALVTKRNELLKELKKLRVGNDHLVVIAIAYLISLAKKHNYGICISQGFIYLFNGKYWEISDNETVQLFLGNAAERMGIIWRAKYYAFHKDLLQQLIAVANISKRDSHEDKVLINLKNGTFEIESMKQLLRCPDRRDFITYQLSFPYSPSQKAPRFQEFLDKVLPDKDSQALLAEYIGYLFIRPGTLKLDKALFLYGQGANGKSVFFEVIYALLGAENISSFSLQSITDVSGYYRAMLKNKLVNYASEINGKLNTAILKQLISGEPVEARLPYGDPFILTNYAKLLFNCNELPNEIEQTHAYFRRLLIVNFSVTIPEAEQDKQLAQKIIASELSGVFNWVLDGLNRLLIQKNFTNSKAANDQLEEYKIQSDSVQMFLREEEYEKSTTDFIEYKKFFPLYRSYCTENGYHPCSGKTFSSRLRHIGFVFERKNYGIIIYVKKVSI